MEPRVFKLNPEVSPQTIDRLDDYRETNSPNEEYIDISTSTGNQLIGVSLTLDEAERLRDELTAMLDTELP